ncbi:MAG: hypothetical protein ABFR31_03205 [Thermodesulfobacteriota bacterium]
MKVSIIYIIISLALLSCSLGPNPNPGERTVDGLIINKSYKKAIYKLNKKNDPYPWEQLRLAIIFEEGLGVDKDISWAFNLYKAVAKSWGNDPWSMGNMAGGAMFGNSGYFKQNSNALFAQYKISQFYYNGEYVKKDLLKSYLLIQNILSKGKQVHNFRGVYCCEYFNYKYTPLWDIHLQLKLIESEMSIFQKQKAEKLILTRKLGDLI